MGGGRPKVDDENKENENPLANVINYLAQNSQQSTDQSAADEAVTSGLTPAALSQALNSVLQSGGSMLGSPPVTRSASAAQASIAAAQSQRPEIPPPENDMPALIPIDGNDGDGSQLRAAQTLSTLASSSSTNDYDQQLQRALELSKKELQATSEDKELALALEMSKKDKGWLPPVPMDIDPGVAGVTSEEAALSSAIQMSMQTGTYEVSQKLELRDPNSTPAGLQNVGNTCYFNSLMQTYFNIPALRNAILEYPQNEVAQGDLYYSSVVFLRALQKIFVQLLSSNSSCVDPSEALKKLIGSDGQPVKIGNQEDVGEFNENFLHRIREGLNFFSGHSMPTPTPPKKARIGDVNNNNTPYKSPGSSITLSSSTTFSAPSNAVASQEFEGDLDLIQKLFSGVTVTILEAPEQDGGVYTAQQSSPFFFLPLPLQRGDGDIYDAFEQHMTGSMEFTTPKNFVTTATSSAWFKRLPSVLMLHQTRVVFDSTRGHSHKVNTPIHLRKTIYLDNFLHENLTDATATRNDIKQRKKLLEERNKTLDSVTKYKGRSHSIVDALTSVKEFLDESSGESGIGNSNTTTGLSHNDHAHLREMMNRLMINEENRMIALQSDCFKLKESILGLYEGEKKHPYVLYALWIHSGAAAHGHYYAYLHRGVNGNEWHCFNDRRVSVATEEVVLRDAQGTLENGTSAYYLIYVNEKELEEVAGAAFGGIDVAEVSKKVPVSVLQEVLADNEMFKEKVEKEKEKERKDKITKMVTSLKSRWKDIETEVYRMEIGDNTQGGNQQVPNAGGTSDNGSGGVLSFNMSDFPALASGESSSTAGMSFVNSVRSTAAPPAQDTQFNLGGEDFPALPGFKGGNDRGGGAGAAGSGAGRSPQGGGDAFDNFQPSDGSHTQSSQSQAQRQALGHFLQQPSQNRGGGQQQAEVSEADKYSLLGLLGVIRVNDAQLSELALGTDLTTLGLNLNSPDSLYSSFTSPFADQPSSDDQVYIPHCYYMQPPMQPAMSKIHLFSDETLFYIFYAMPTDILQAYAALELYKREWRYHKEHKLWFTRVAGTEPFEKNMKFERGSFFYFDIGSWEKRRRDNFVLQLNLLDRRPEVPNQPPQQ